jgi:uncharacterized protein (UPF0303 family)
LSLVDATENDQNTSRDEQAERASLIELLLHQNEAIDFPSFTYDDAFAVGCDIVRRATDPNATAAVSIVFGEQRVFHAARPGTTADNDDWLRRKIRLVSRFNLPSLLVREQFASMGIDLTSLPHLAPAEYALAGGGFPLRVNGSLIGAIAVSGLTDREDHDLVVAALEAALGAKR